MPPRPDKAAQENGAGPNAGSSLLDAVIDDLSDGLAIFDENAALVQFNRAWLAMNPAIAHLVRSGLSWDILLREWVARAGLPRHDCDRLSGQERQLGEGLAPQPLDVRWPTGDVHRLSLRAVRAGGFVLMQTDVSARQRSAENELEADELLRKVLEACPANVIMSRVGDGQILYRSPAATELLGTVRRTHDHFAHRGERADFITALLPNGRVEDMPITGLRPDGRSFPCLISARLIEYRGEDVIVSSTVDISRDVELRRKLAQQREQIFLSEKMSALGELLAGVAHELNNPLSVVVGHALMMHEETTDPEVARRIGKISEAAKRCSRIVKSFLAMARQQPVMLAPFDLAAAARQAVEAKRMGPDGLSVEVDFDLPPDLPQVLGDAHQVSQVILNLVTNAEHAVLASGQPGRVVVAASAEPGATELVFTVADNGPGIDPAIHSRIFDPLFTTKDVGKGTGIGLAFCHRVVTAHGGHIWFEPGNPGARFHVSLPVAVDTAKATDRIDQAGGIVGKGSILIVDDEPEVAELIREILARDGFTVDSASSAEAALPLIRARSYTLILSDLNMPGAGGRGLYDAVTRESPDLARRLAFITGDTMSPHVRSFLDTTDRPYLEKPISPAELRRLVARILGTGLTGGHP